MDGPNPELLAAYGTDEVYLSNLEKRGADTIFGAQTAALSRGDFGRMRMGSPRDQRHVDRFRSEADLMNQKFRVLETQLLANTVENMGGPGTRRSAYIRAVMTQPYAVHPLMGLYGGGQYAGAVLPPSAETEMPREDMGDVDSDMARTASVSTAMAARLGAKLAHMTKAANAGVVGLAAPFAVNALAQGLGGGYGAQKALEVYERSPEYQSAQARLTPDELKAVRQQEMRRGASAGATGAGLGSMGGLLAGGLGGALGASALGIDPLIGLGVGGALGSTAGGIGGYKLMTRKYAGAASPLTKEADLSITKGKGKGDPRLTSIGWFTGGDSDEDYAPVSKRQAELLLAHGSLQAARRAYEEERPDLYNTVASALEHAPEKPGLWKRVITLGSPSSVGKKYKEDLSDYERRVKTPAIFLHSGPSGSPAQHEFYDAVHGGKLDPKYTKALGGEKTAQMGKYPSAPEVPMPPPPQSTAPSIGQDFSTAGKELMGGTMHLGRGVTRAFGKAVEGTGSLFGRMGRGLQDFMMSEHHPTPRWGTGMAPAKDVNEYGVPIY